MYFILLIGAIQLLWYGWKNPVLYPPVNLSQCAFSLGFTRIKTTVLAILNYHKFELAVWTVGSSYNTLLFHLHKSPFRHNSRSCWHWEKAFWNNACVMIQASLGSRSLIGLIGKLGRTRWMHLVVVTTTKIVTIYFLAQQTRFHNYLIACIQHVHRPQKVLGHLLQGELRGKHQIRNAISRQRNVVGCLHFVWLYITRSFKG